jgi:hypothetical protein
MPRFKPGTRLLLVSDAPTLSSLPLLENKFRKPPAYQIDAIGIRIGETSAFRKQLSKSSDREAVRLGISCVPMDGIVPLLSAPDVRDRLIKRCSAARRPLHFS